MGPLFRALKDRLWNEPVFFLTTLAALAPVLQDTFSLPGYVAPIALVLYGLCVRASVTPTNKR